MTGADLITYDAVARWLPTDVRERIECTRPCLGGIRHDWRHEAVEICTADTVIARRYEWWQCDRCEVVVKADPEAYA